MFLCNLECNFGIFLWIVIFEYKNGRVVLFSEDGLECMIGCYDLGNEVLFFYFD